MEPSQEASRLLIRNAAEEMLRVAAWLEESAEQRGLGPELAFRLDLVLNEAIPNVIAYAFPGGGTHHIEIALAGDDDRVWLEIVDDGIPFDPFARPARTEAASLEEASASGRGIHLIRAYSEWQEYARRDGRNHVRIGFPRRAGAEGSPAAA